MMKRIINLFLKKENIKFKKSIIFIEKFPGKKKYNELLDFSNYYEFIFSIIDILKKENKMDDIKNLSIIKNILDS